MNRSIGEFAVSRTWVEPPSAAVALDARTHATADTVTMKVNLRNIVFSQE
jgi:hypothetical protein